LSDLGEKSIKLAIMILGLGILICASGCTMKRAMPTFPKSQSTQAGQQESVKQVPPYPQQQPVKPNPRLVAASNLVEQGKNYLDSQMPDKAIDVFERALSVSPDNGIIYYYMAQAWMMKNNKHQALEFNRLAGIYFSDDSAWLERVKEQQQQIKGLP
jgi:tetratricopeptide (TPR) repeat protein